MPSNGPRPPCFLSPPSALPALPSAAELRTWTGERGLPQAKQLPPGQAEGQPDQHVDHGQDEADTPPGRLGDVAEAEDDRRRRGAVVGQARREVGEVNEG